MAAGGILGGIAGPQLANGMCDVLPQPFAGTYAALIGVALLSLLLGMGWNFRFIGGTALLTNAYQPEEKTTAKVAMDTTIYVTMAVPAFASGALVTTGGWTWMNLGTLVPIGLVATALGWLALHRRRATLAAAGGAV